MPLTITHGPRYVAGDKRHHIAQITISGNYPAGGEPVEASDFDLKNLDYLLTSGPNRNRCVYYDEENQKLQVFNDGTGVEHSGNITANTAPKIHVLAIGV